MDRKIMKLRSLAQLDVDAIGAYEVAISHANNYEVKGKLREFQADHQRHVRELNACIARLGGRVVDLKPDLKGVILKSFTSITSMMGNEAALLAMFGNEEITTRTYQTALKFNDWSADERELIEKNYADEQRHLAWIKVAAKERQWAHHEQEMHP